MHKKLKLEKKIPIPNKSRGAFRSYYYRWWEMKKGDSVYFEGNREGRSAHSHFLNYIKFNNPKWEATSRVIRDEKTFEVIGVRVWRVK